MKFQLLELEKQQKSYLNRTRYEGCLIPNTCIAENFEVLLQQQTVCLKKRDHQLQQIHYCQSPIMALIELLI